VKDLRTLAIALLAITAAVLIIGVNPAPSRPGDTKYLRAHASAVKWHRQADDLQHRLTRRVLEARSLHRALRARQSSLEAIRLASIVYHVDFHLLYRRASCESMGMAPASPASERTLNRYAKNPTSTASGLFQFLTSTWASTPYAGESIWSPYANALAAAWMVSVGRGGEWVCA